MANSTVIQLVQAFCQEYGVPVPTGIAGTPDAGALQMRALLQAAGTYAWAASNWQECSRRATWTSVDGTDQGAIKTLCPEDMAGITPNTFWDITTKQEITGPVSDETWMALQTSHGQGAASSYRIANGRLELAEALVAGHTLSLIYKSRRWIVPAAGDKKTAFTLDTDTSIFSDNLMLQGLRAYWLRIKQMPHKLEFETFDDMILQEASLGTVKPVLQMDGTGGSRAAGIVLPIGSWIVP